MTLVISNSSKHSDKSPSAEQPLSKSSLVKGMSMQDVILPDGNLKRMLVLAEDQDKFKDFVMVFRNRGGKELMIDPTALGIFYFLATTHMDYRNVCEITAKTLAKQVHKSEPIVKKLLNELIEYGYVKRLKNGGMYMLSPYYTTQIRKRYFDILRKAWQTGNVSRIRADMEILDDAIARETELNKKLVKMAKANLKGEERTSSRESITIPVAASTTDEYQYIKSVLEEEI